MKVFVFLLLLSVATCDYVFDLKKPIERIQGKIAETVDHPPDFTVIPVIIAKLLPCLDQLGGGGGTFKVEDDGLPEDLKRFIESLSPKTVAENLQKANWEELFKGNASINKAENWDDWRHFMATPKFLKIHNFLWKNDNNKAYKKIINFIESAGYQNAIYTAIKRFYTDMGQVGLIGDISGTIKEGKTQAPQGFTRNVRSAEFPVSLNKKIFAEEECDLMKLVIEILGMINQANLHLVIQMVLYILQEVLGNPAMHVLMIDIGEPATGQAVHELFMMPEMDEFVPLLSKLVFSDAGVGQINAIVKLAVGLDLGTPMIFMYIINLIQYLVWGISFP